MARLRKKSTAGNEEILTTSHAEDEGAHGATPSADPNKIVRRDKDGRAEVAAPALPSHIANRGFVEESVGEALVVFSDHEDEKTAHGATPNLDPNRIVLRDGEGRARISDPVDDDHIASFGSVKEAVNEAVEYAEGLPPNKHASTHGVGGTDPITPAAIGAAPADHTHTPAQVGAAPVNHTHTPQEIGAAPADHTHTPAQIGAAPANHTHTPQEIGAAPANHTHTPAQIGAAPANHTHTAAQVGAAPANHTHSELPTAAQKGALAGTSGSPSASNKYVTNSDPRLSDARTPTNHHHDDRYYTKDEIDAAIGGSTFTWMIPGDTVLATVSSSRLHFGGHIPGSPSGYRIAAIFVVKNPGAYRLKWVADAGAGIVRATSAGLTLGSGYAEVGQFDFHAGLFVGPGAVVMVEVSLNSEYGGNITTVRSIRICGIEGHGGLYGDVWTAPTT